MSYRGSWMTDYADEVLSYMRHKEMQHLPYYGNSPQLTQRNGLVDFLCLVCERLKLSVATTHISVYLLDRFMDAHNISDNQLRLTVLTTILLASKFEEKDANIPRIPDLNAFTSDKYSIGIFNTMEAFMLNFFNWNIGPVTAAHFSELFLVRGVTAGDTVEGEPITSPAMIREELWRTTAHFLDISLQDKVFLQWPSSQVASACIACGRLCCHLFPTWPQTLQVTARYQLQSLSPIMDLLFRLYENEELRECSSPDSAYSSHCSSIHGSPERS